MKGEKLISIIIPLYNLEKKYLHPCIESILFQEFKEYEVLLIDDGSAPQYVSVYQIIAWSDERLHLYHQTNRGVSAARNLGLEKACGDWILFVDGDDWLTKDALTILYQAACTYKGDILCARNYYHEHGVDVANYYSGNPIEILEGDGKEELIATIFYGKSKHFSSGAMPWAKLYRREFLRTNHLQFVPEIPIGEDGLFNFKAFFLAKRMVCIDQFVYYYRKYEESASSIYREDIPSVCNQLFLNYKEMLIQLGVWKRYENDLCNMIYRYWDIYLIKRFLLCSCKNSLTNRIKVFKGIKDKEEVILFQVGKRYGGKMDKLKAFLIRHKKIRMLVYFESCKTLINGRKRVVDNNK